MRTKILIALCLMCLLSSCRAQDTPKDAGKTEAVNAAGWYGEHLNGLQRNVYEAFAEAARSPFAKELTPVSPADDAGWPTMEEVSEVYQIYLYDHPELFWLGTSYRYGCEENTDKITSVGVISIFASEADLKAAQKAFDEAAQETYAQIAGEKTDAAKAEKLCEILSSQVAYEEEAVYDNSRAQAHSAYGALVSRSAVCDGYALACQYVLSMAGIPCLCIPGESNVMAHVWNTAYWDGAWHEIDITWDALQRQQNSGQKLRYFDRSTVQMEEDHIREPQGAAVMAPAAP